MTGEAVVKPRRTYDLAGAEGDYPDWSGAPESTLVICSHPRSGSTLLSEALYFAGGLGCPLEYFHIGFRPDLASHWQVSDFPDYVRALYRHRTDPSGVLSLKLFWHDMPGLLDELAPGRFDGILDLHPAKIENDVYRDIRGLLETILPSPRYLWLRRDDAVAQAVSVAVANQRRRWRQIDASDPAHRADVEFRFDGLIQALARIQRRDAHWARFFEANDLIPIDMRYEALSSDYDGEVRRVLDLLGRGDAEVRAPRLIKQADAQSQRITALFRARFRALSGSRA